MSENSESRAYEYYDYFDIKCSEWNILGFLKQCNVEPFDVKIDYYLKCLENIVRCELGNRQKKAQELIDRYRKEPRPDKKIAKRWDQERSHRQITVNQPTYTEISNNGTIYGGTINNETFGGNSSKNISKRAREKDEIDDFFQRPSKRQSSNLFGEVEQDISNEIDNGKGEIIHRTEIHKRDESPHCLNCDAVINISIFRFCPFCGTNIVSSEDLDYGETDEESTTSDRDEDENTPPKVDKIAFSRAYNSIPDSSKLRLSTGKIDEDVLFKFAKDMDYEHHAHSYIVDFDDENIKALFTDEERKELTEDRIGVPSVPSDIVKEMARYGKKTLEELRITVMTTYIKSKERYDNYKHFNQEWIQMTMRTLCNLYENVDSPLIRSQYEDWYTIALFGTCIDFCMRDMQLGTDIKRTDAPSVSSANRKNRGRQANTHTRKLIGRKIDGIIYSVDRKLEIGAIEAARSFLSVSDRKYLLEAFKMPKTLRDMYTDLMIAANYEQQKADKLQVVGIIHLGVWIQFVRLWRAGGSICIFRKDPRSFNVDSKFSKEAVKSFLKLLVTIYQYKLIIKDNLQVLDIRNNNDNGSEDDLENELMEASRSSAPSPVSTVEFFADNTKTPRKSKKKKPVKKRRLNKN